MTTATDTTLKEYFAAVGSRFTDKDAQVIGPELERLAKEGRTRADDIVEVARDPKSPLHPYIEWDNEVAADHWRQTQARHMMNAVHIRIIKDDSIEFEGRAFHPIPIAIIKGRDIAESPTRQMPYLHWEEIANDPDMLKVIVEEARLALVGWQARFKKYKYIQKIQAASEKLDQVIEALS